MSAERPDRSEATFARARSAAAAALGVRLTADDLLRATTPSRLKEVLAVRLAATDGPSHRAADARRDIGVALGRDVGDDELLAGVLPRKGRVGAWMAARKALGVRVPGLRWRPVGVVILFAGAAMVISSIVLATRVMSDRQLEASGHVALHLALTFVGGWLLALTNRFTVPPPSLARGRDLAAFVVLARASQRGERAAPPTRDEVREVVTAACHAASLPRGVPPALLGAAIAAGLLTVFVLTVVLSAPERS